LDAGEYGGPVTRQTERRRGCDTALCLALRVGPVVIWHIADLDGGVSTVCLIDVKIHLLAAVRFEAEGNLSASWPAAPSVRLQSTLTT